MDVVNSFKDAELLSPSHRQLRELLRLSERIYECATRGDWEGALPMQQQRRREMDAFFVTRCRPSDAALVSAVIEEILRIDDAVTTLLHQRRGAILNRTAEQRRSAAQLGSYLRHA